MRVSVNFDGESWDWDMDDQRLLAVWQAPPSMETSQITESTRQALETPLGFPPLRQAIVPGDKVTLALDSNLPGAVQILNVIGEVLQTCGVEDSDVLALSLSEPTPQLKSAVSERFAGWQWKTLDRGRRIEFAYLASTETGNRIYLHRGAIDADVVVPIGRLGFDPIVGRRGPWSVLFPGLADSSTIKDLKPCVPGEEARTLTASWAPLLESLEVERLLGAHFQVGVLPGHQGPSRIIAGEAEAIFQESLRAVDSQWILRTDQRASVVVAGIEGPSGMPSSLDDIAKGLTAAANLVQRGGRIILLSRAVGDIGRSLQRLLSEDGSDRSPTQKLKGLESEPDYGLARQIARAADWADVYLLSNLEPDLFEPLSIVSLSSPKQAQKMIVEAPSCLVIQQANSVFTMVSDD